MRTAIFEKRDVKPATDLAFDEYTKQEDNWFVPNSEERKAEAIKSTNKQFDDIFNSSIEKGKDCKEKLSWDNSDEIPEENQESDRLQIKDEWTFSVKYQSTDKNYHFSLILKNSELYITDNGLTLEMLDKVFELKEVDVIKNLVAILRECRARKRSKEIIIVVRKESVETEIDTPEMNWLIDDAKDKLLRCIFFMDTMRIFYI